MGVSNTDRRFFCVAEKAAAAEAGSMRVTGEVHGKICVGDTVYIMDARGRTAVSEVKRLEIKGVLGQKKIAAAEDMAVDILIGQEAGSLDKFSVLSNIRPQSQADVNTAAENPYIAGLLYELYQFSGDAEYMNKLFYAVAHGHYITPVQLSSPPQDNQDGTATFRQNSTMGFLMLADPREEQMPENDAAGKCLLPVFTDWAELGKWSALDTKGKVNVILLPFPDIAAITGKSSCSGFIINPYSRNQMLFDRQYIDMITASEGYQKDFCQKDGGVKEHKIEKDTQVQIGVPALTDEVKRIRKELAAYGKKNQDIHAIYMLLKVESDQTMSYLLLLDTEAAEPRQHFAAIYEAIKSDAVNIPLVDFIVKGQIASIDKVAAKDDNYLAYRE